MTNERHRKHVILDKAPNTVGTRTKKGLSNCNAAAALVKGEQFISRFLGEISIHNASIIFNCLNNGNHQKQLKESKLLSFETDWI